MRRQVVITAALFLTACQMSAPVAADECGAGAMQDMVGEPAEILALIDLPSPVRIIHPGDAVTRDYRLERLNFHIDAEGRIERIDCG
jgi:hypothetical protein